MSERARNPAARHTAIERQILLNGSLSVESLARELDVSVATIRRDLTALDTEGVLRRTHGGATAKARRGAEQAFAQRERVDADGKRLIARQAIALIEADQTLFMNDGSTILALARELLVGGLPLTVITPGANVAICLAENPQILAYLLGGQVRHRVLATSGDFTEQMLRAFNADVALIAADGFSRREGLTYAYESDAKIARLMAERAATVVVLATARKLEARDRITALAAERVDVLVTDSDDEGLLACYRDLGVSISRAASDTAFQQESQGHDR